jgi:Cdc6-like AAA superfamily ATPase
VAASERDLSPKEATDLHTIRDGCQNILLKLEDTLGKYAELESRQTSLGGKIKRVWKKLSLEPEAIRNLRSRVNDNITLLNAFTMQRTKDNTTKLVRHQESREQQEIFEWLTPVDYHTQQNDFLKQRQTGTGQWLLDSPQFKTWVEAKHQTLFCPGIPGAGKTILTSTVVEELCTRFQDDSGIVVGYIFCNYKQQNEQTVEHLLASLLKQLAQGRPSPLESVKSLYTRCQSKNTRPGVDDISAALQSVAFEYSRVYIIIDALDECSAKDGCRTQLLSKLSHLQVKCGINIFATSRFIPEIVEEFKQDPSLEVRANEQDVQRYLDGRISHLPQFIRNSPDLQHEIKTEVVKAVDGM